MKKIVIKVGSHVLSDDGKISLARVDSLCDLLYLLMQKYEVILVSSGAIACGQAQINLERDSVLNKQILAAIGQAHLMQVYTSSLSRYGKFCAQLLLNASDFDSRKRTNYAKSVVLGLLKLGVLPIINENDATATAEIVYGDNDRLSAAAALHFEADMLVMLSDIDGYYDADPRTNKNAKIRKIVSALDDDEISTHTNKSGSKHGTGGIATKLIAAKMLLDENKSAFLASGFDLSVVKDFLLNDKQNGGTLFRA